MNPEKEHEVIERLVSAEQRSRSNTHQIDDIKKDIENIKTTEVLVKKHEDDIHDLKSQSATIYKLVVNQENMGNTLKVMAEDNRRQMDTFTETLGNMNDSLSQMSSSQLQMANEVNVMQKDITSTKDHIEEVEKLAQTNKESMNFNIVKFFTSDGTKIILTAVLVAILSFIGLK